jgi:hypothetical protein
LAKAVFAALFVLLTSLFRLPAQEVFVISEINDSNVLVVPSNPGAKSQGEASSSLTPFEIFDVYASQDPETGFSCFVDSLYFKEASKDGISMRYVWKGEKKFLQKNFFVIRTGRIYQIEENGTPTAGAVVVSRGSPLTSFGVPGLEVAVSGGMGGVPALPDWKVVYASSRARFNSIGVSIRGSFPAVPNTHAASFTSAISGCVDLY